MQKLLFLTNSIFKLVTIKWNIFKLHSNFLLMAEINLLKY